MKKDKSKAATSRRETGSAGGKDASQDALWHYEPPQQDAQTGAGARESNSAHYTGGAHGGDSQQGDFMKSPPEANAMPAGAPQTSRGSAGLGGADPQTRPAPGAGGGANGGGGAGGGGGAALPDTLSGSGNGAGSDLTQGAGGGQPAPVGNGTKDEPIWGS